MRLFCRGGGGFEGWSLFLGGDGAVAFVEDVDIDADAFFDGDDATNLANGLDDLARFADDAAHVFGVDLNTDADQTIFFGFVDNDIFRVVDNVGDNVLEELFHFDLATRLLTVGVGWAPFASHDW